MLLCCRNRSLPESLCSGCTYTVFASRLSGYRRKVMSLAFQGLLDNDFDDSYSRDPRARCGPSQRRSLWRPRWSVESWLRPLFLWVPNTILWLFLHFWSEQLKQTSSATGSTRMPRKQGVVCFSAGGKLSGEGWHMWCLKPRSALSLSERRQNI